MLFPSLDTMAQLESEAAIRQSLSPGQIKAYDACIGGTRSVFCTGEGGTGKSWLVECIIAHYKLLPQEQSSKIAVTASTGMAAFLVKGITLHRFAGIGVEENDLDVMVGRARYGNSRALWRDTSILIIDEISMISGELFENLSHIGQILRSSSAPFGGIRLLMFGDFLQLPPVSKTATERVFETSAWDDLDVDIYYLKTILRQRDPYFASALSNIRQGICPDETEMYIQSLDRTVQYDDGIEPVRLYALRRSVDSYNTVRLDAIHAQSHTYTAVDSGNISILNACPAPKQINLKQGAQVMLIRNMGSGAVNGSIGIIEGFDYCNTTKSFQPMVRLAIPGAGSRLLHISPTAWQNIMPDGRVISQRIQIPLILAWAITIHKSQGQTIPRLIVNMSGVFENGQAYVALSRSSDPSQLQVINFDKSLVRADPAAVLFYGSFVDGSEYIEPSSPPPEYDTIMEQTEDAMVSAPETSATGVAYPTIPSWGRNLASPPEAWDQNVDDLEQAMNAMTTQ